jgi:soluble cytochrome b562
LRPRINSLNDAGSSLQRRHTYSNGVPTAPPLQKASYNDSSSAQTPNQEQIHDRVTNKNSNTLKLFSMNEDGIVREISSQSSINTPDDDAHTSNSMSPYKQRSLVPEEEFKDFHERFSYLVVRDDAENLAQSIRTTGAGRNAIQQHTVSTKSECEEDIVFKLR